MSGSPPARMPEIEVLLHEPKRQERKELPREGWQAGGVRRQAVSGAIRQTPEIRLTLP